MLFDPVHILSPQAIIHSNIVFHGHLRFTNGRFRRLSVNFFYLFFPQIYLKLYLYLDHWPRSTNQVAQRFCFSRGSTQSVGFFFRQIRPFVARLGCLENMSENCYLGVSFVVDTNDVIFTEHR